MLIKKRFQVKKVVKFFRFDDVENTHPNLPFSGRIKEIKNYV